MTEMECCPSARGKRDSSAQSRHGTPSTRHRKRDRGLLEANLNYSSVQEGRGETDEMPRHDGAGQRR